MAIPLTRANRLAAMRESDERITSIFTRARSPYEFCKDRGVSAGKLIPKGSQGKNSSLTGL